LLQDSPDSSTTDTTSSTTTAAANAGSNDGDVVDGQSSSSSSTETATTTSTVEQTTSSSSSSSSSSAGEAGNTVRQLEDALPMLRRGVVNLEPGSDAWYYWPVQSKWYQVEIVAIRSAAPQFRVHWPRYNNSE
jgi:hypothetical protein